MKNSIQGFNQHQAIELGLDSTDLTLLRWFIDFRDTEGMTKRYDPETNQFLYWVKYSKILDDLPILVVKSKGDIKAKKKMIQRILAGNLSQVLKREIVKSTDGTYLFLKLNEANYLSLIKEKVAQDVDLSAPDKNVQPGKTNLSRGGGQNCPYKDKTINNKTINNSSSKEEAEEVVIDKKVIEQIKDRWNSIHELNKPGITKLLSLKQGTQRYRSLHARLEEYDLETVLNAIDSIKKSDLFMGRVEKSSKHKNWKLSFEWFVDSNNFIKVLEEKYISEESPSPGTIPGEIMTDSRYIIYD